MSTKSEVKSKSCEVKSNSNEKVRVNIAVDFTGVTRDQLMDWALSNRVIAGQRPWRELSNKEIRDKVDSQTFNALTIGRKIQSREDQVKATMNPAAGVTRELAEWIVDNPEEYKKMLEAMKGKSETKETKKETKK